MSKHKRDDNPRLTIEFSEFKKLLNGFIPPELEDHISMHGNKLYGIYNLDIVGDFLHGIVDGLFLCEVDLVNITFNECYFDGTFFKGCYLKNVVFNHCKFFGSTFCWCSFRFVGFGNSTIYQAIFIENDIEHTAFPSNYYIPMVCPETGSFTGWKQGYGGRIIQLEIPADAKRSSANGRKCRCDKAKVISIVDGDGNQVEEAVSYTDPDFIYKVGETVYPDGWDSDRWNECSKGIHFFMTRKEAVEYEF